MEVLGLTMFAAPASGGFKAKLPAGETVTVEFEPPAHATGVSVRPDRYAEFEVDMVPAADRDDDKYVGYALTILLQDLETSFEKLGAA